MHSIKKMLGFLILLLIAFRASAEIIRHHPDHSTERDSQSENHKSKVCFVGTNFWDTTAVRTLLTVAEREAPYQDCLDETSEAEILGKMFSTVGFDQSEKVVLMTGLMEAMMLIYNGEEVLNKMAQTGEFSNSYLHYFRPEDFSTVRNAVTWLSRLLGKPPRENFVDFDDIPSHIPLIIYHQDKYSKQPNLCHQKRGVRAFMASSGLWGWVVKEGSHSVMCICEGWDRTRTLARAPCEDVKDHRIPRRISSTPGSILTHELFHWTAVAESNQHKQGIGDRICNSQSKGFLGKPQSAYGSLMSQELRRSEPWKSASNSDSYTFFLLEEYFQKRCELENWFDEETLDNMSVNIGKDATAIFYDSLFEHPVRKVIRWKLVQKILQRYPVQGLNVIEMVFDFPYRLACIMFLMLCLNFAIAWFLDLLIKKVLQKIWLTRSDTQADPRHPQYESGFESTSQSMHLNGRLQADPKHPQHELGFGNTSQFMHLNGKIAPRDDELLRRINEENGVQ